MMVSCCALAMSKCSLNSSSILTTTWTTNSFLPLQKERLFLLHFVAVVKRRLSTISNKRNLIFFGSDSFSIGVFRELLTQYRPNLGKIEACVVGKHVLFAKYLTTYHPDVPINIWPTLPHVDDSKFALVASFGKLIPESFISQLPNRILNIHPSLLPRWRGAAPMPRCIMAGDLVVGVSVVEIAPRQFDVGRVLLQQELVPNSQMKIDQLGNTLATMGVRLLVEGVLSDLDGAFRKAKEQKSLPYKSTLARRLYHFDLNVDWSRSTATELVRLYAATLASDHHHKNATGQLRTSYDGHAVRLIQMDLMPALDAEKSSESSHCEDSRPGRIVFDVKHRDRLLVKSLRGWVSIRRLIYKKPMSASDFFNGYLSKKPENDHYFE